MPTQDGIGDKAPTPCLLHRRTAAAGFWPTWTAPTTVFVSPSTTMITLTSSCLFSSSSSPRSDPSFVVDSSFLPPNSMGMTVTGSSSWDRNVDDFFNDALGNAFLWNQLGHLSNFLPNLQNWHNGILLNNVFGMSSVHVTRSLLPPSQITLVKSSRWQQCSGNVEISLIIFFFPISPSNCVISSLWSPLHVMTQLASSSMGQATLIALSCSSSFFTVFLKIHRFHLIALDHCEWPRTFPTSRAVGLNPSRNFVKHVILSGIVALCARSGLSFRTIDSKLPC